MDEFIPGTIKPESDYEEMMRLGAILGLPVPQMHLGVQIQQPDGTITQHYNGRSRTWVRNFWNNLFGSMSGVQATGTTFAAGSLGLKRTTAANNTVPSLDLSNNVYNSFGLKSNSGAYIGIVVGTGTTAESFEHYNLIAPITSGTNAGQLVIGSQTTIATYNSVTKTWTSTIVKQFTNSSISDNVVAETGLIYGSGDGTFWLLFCRDKLASAVNVPVGSVLTVTYTLTLAFPA
jgi:hypothetical protein